MAQGGNLDTTILGVRKAKLYSMLENIALIDNGSWIQDEGLDSGTLETVQTAAGTLTSFSVQLYGSNSKDMPTDDGFAIGAAITAQGLTAITTKCRWYKVKCTAISVSGGAKLSARMHCQTFK